MKSLARSSLFIYVRKCGDLCAVYLGQFSSILSALHEKFPQTVSSTFDTSSRSTVAVDAFLSPVYFSPPFSPSLSLLFPKQRCRILCDRYLLWERFADFRFFRQVRSRGPRRLVTYDSALTRASLTIHIFMNFHSPLLRNCSLLCAYSRVCISGSDEKTIGLEFLRDHSEVSLFFPPPLPPPPLFFTLIDRQNVNAQIFQTAESANNLYSNENDIGLLASAVLQLALQFRAQMERILLE